MLSHNQHTKEHNVQPTHSHEILQCNFCVFHQGTILKLLSTSAQRLDSFLGVLRLQFLVPSFAPFVAAYETYKIPGLSMLIFN